ncbi:helix-turn-helix domain-containing protein [Streptomyces sp. NPDC001108]
MSTDFVRMAIPGKEDGYALVPHEFVWDFSIGVMAKHLWLVLIGLKDGNGSVRMSYGNLAKTMGRSDSTVWRAAKELEEHGYLAVERPVKAKSTYQLLFQGERIQWPED